MTQIRTHDIADGVVTDAKLASAFQPSDSDLTAIAALTTTSYGRALLALADAAAGRTAFGLGTAATSASGDFDAAGAAAAAQAASQPVDSDLTAIAALTTTTYGRAFLALADAADGRTALGLGTLATQSGTFSGTTSGTNTGDQTVPGFATNAVALGAAAAAGAASTVMRSNDTIAAFDATVPTTQAFGDAAAVGTAAFAARRDHKHAMPALTVARAAGTSASGTPATAVAALTAAASTQFVGWSIAASQANAASTQFKVIVTYSDATTDTDTSTAASATQVVANAGGIERMAAGVHSAQVALQSKAVTGLRVETAGAGTGIRAAVISAIQVPV